MRTFIGEDSVYLALVASSACCFSRSACACGCQNCGEIGIITEYTPTRSSSSQSKNKETFIRVVPRDLGCETHLDPQLLEELCLVSANILIYTTVISQTKRNGPKIETHSLELSLSHWRAIRGLVYYRVGDVEVSDLKPLEDATLPSPRVLLDICLDATRAEGRRRAAIIRVASMIVCGELSET